MVNRIDAGLIALTYKGKILLLHQDPIPPSTVFEQKIWRFIEAEKGKNESCEEAIFKKVKQETNIKLSSVAFISTNLYGNQTRYFYHAQLTDKNVNEIKRGDGQNLDFFSLKELENLLLTAPTKLFAAQYKDLLIKLPN